MSYFDKRPEMFRWLFGSLTLLLLLLGGTRIYRFGSSPTDENWFKNPPSYLYVSRSFPATLESDDQSTVTRDSVIVSDLLLSINGNDVATFQQVQAHLRNIPVGSDIRLSVLRTQEDRQFVFTARRKVIPDDFIRELGNFAHVFEVTQDGASDRAGMKAGDLIVTVNGKKFGSAFEADDILRDGQIGKSIEYEVLRNNEVVKLHVTLAAFGFPIALLVFVLCGGLFIGTGIFIGLRRPNIIAARLLGMFFLFIGYFIMSGLSQRGTQAGWFASFVNVTLVISIFAGMAVMVHAAHYFPKERPDLLTRKWILKVVYALPVLVIPSVYIFGDALLLVGILLMAVYSIGISIAFRKGASEEYRKINRLIRRTSIAVVALTGLYFYYLVRTSFGGNVQNIGMAGIIIAAIPLVYLYTIGRYRLLDLDLRIRRNIQYSFASLAWLLVAGVILCWFLVKLPQTELALPNIRLTGASIEVLDDPLTPQDRVTAEKTALMIFAVALALVVWKGTRVGQRLIAKRFHRQEYDYRRAASELAEVMATRLDMTGLAKGIVEKLTSLMHLKHAGVVFFRNQSACCCQAAEGFDGTVWKAFCINHEHDLVEAFKKYDKEFRVDYLPAEIRSEFQNQQFQFVIPIRSKEKLVGAILVGEKLSESHFGPEDMEFLRSTAKQASVAIENAFLYEELAEQERMKHELAIARRIQLASLPQKTPQIDGLDIAGVSVPAMEVGGDYFDYLNGDINKLTVIVGDVSGKGTSAALYMSKVQGILRSLHGFGLSPRDLFIRTNHLLCQDMEKKSFITAMGGFFNANGKELILARAGHLPLFQFHHSSGTVERIVPHGLGLGLSSEKKFANELEEKTVHFERGDVFLFVTDGITEAQTLQGDEFGEERLENLLMSSSGLKASQIRDNLLKVVKSFAGDASQHDDQTVVVVKSI